jgi:prophage antirepressor-like protein
MGLRAFINLNLFEMRQEKIDGNLKPTVFEFGENKLRTLFFNNKPWFVAKDVCNSLELKDTGRALQKLDPDEKLTRKLFWSGQNREMWFANESGLYNLIFRSNKPEAKKFRKWVTAEVLPALRKTGTYCAAQKAPDALAGLINQSTLICGSRQKLAARLGIAAATLSQISNGKRDLFSAEMFQKIEAGCKKLIAMGKVPSTDFKTIEMLMSIEDRKTRLGLYRKMKKGGVL